jgi:hypothetical protein
MDRRGGSADQPFEAGGQALERIAQPQLDGETRRLLAHRSWRSSRFEALPLEAWHQEIDSGLASG